MATAAKKRPRDTQGGEPPKKPARGRQVTLQGSGVPASNGHAKAAKTKKPRGGAAIKTVDDGPAPIEQPESETRLIPLGRIDPSATNPREDFDEAELAKLAESIRIDGLLQAILVRPKLHRYEIVAGERRFRASQLAGLEQVECKVRRLDDWQALKIQWVENADREDINEIEEARHFQRMLDARAVTQTQLATELGTSQAQVANRVRLLDLPEDWQQKVISGEITASHAREVVPFIYHAAALDFIAKQIERDGTCGSVKQFREALEEAVIDHGVELTGVEWDSAAGEYVRWHVPFTDKEAEAWGIEVIEQEGEKHVVAVQCPDAQVAADLARETAIEKARKRAGKRGKTSASQLGDSPAAAAKRSDEQFAKRLAAWKTDWLRVLCAGRFEDTDQFGRIADMFFLAMAFEPDVWARVNEFEEIAEVELELKIDFSSSLYEMVRSVATTVELDEVRVAIAKRLLVDAKSQPRQVVDADDVDDLAKELELPADLEAIWRKDQAGALSEAYWSLHTKEQLEALAEELKIEFREKSKRAMVEQLLETKDLPLPAELGGAKKPKRKGK